MAPRREFYEARNPFETPEPHAKPGYTGYFPDSGPKRIFQMGQVYDRMTHNQMDSHPIAGLRFAVILDTGDSFQRKLDDEVMCWRHEKMTQNVKLRRNMKIGYTGYIPRKKFLIGKSYSDECTAAIALMEKLRLAD